MLTCGFLATTMLLRSKDYTDHVYELFGEINHVAMKVRLDVRSAPQVPLPEC